LVRAGIIRSSAGNRGGYFLARPASTVTLLDVIKTVQGDAPLFVCEEVRCRGIFTDDADAIRETGPCGIHHAMVEAENRWRDSLATVTVEALTQQIGEQGVTRMRDFARAQRAHQ
ncbi:MAG: transcriptional regulator, partial [Kocuria rhizophila]